MTEDISGLILAGGQGARLGGQDKGLVEIGGRPMIAHVIERFSPQVVKLALSANRNQRQYASYGFEVIADDSDDFQGPLAGICEGLSWCPTSHLAVVPCDSPQVPRNLVASLMRDLRARNQQIAMASAGGYRQPVFALIEKSLHASLRSFLQAGERKIGKWFESHHAIEVQFDDINAFANINTEQDRQSVELQLR